MGRQGKLVLAVVGLIVVLVGFGWMARDRFTPVVVGSSAPDFTAREMGGTTVNLKDLRGKVILLNIWATWCDPCREEMPSMQRLYDELGPSGLQVIAVSIDAPLGAADRGGKPGGDVQAFVREFGLTFPIWLDPAGNVQKAYRPTGVPESFVIDRRGNIVKKVIGATDWSSESNLDLIRRLLES
ncbi:MAG: TlpA family protein disulfide reductase [Gemmatimonadota bacterium]|jgi:peroxiredoxin|nr:TlpA family protein disulfide reductase [Gemmatimonadota bacterium]